MAKSAKGKAPYNPDKYPAEGPHHTQGPRHSQVSDKAIMIEHAPGRRYLADPARAIEEGRIVVVTITNKRETVRLIGTVRRLRVKFELELKSGEKIVCETPMRYGTAAIAPVIFEYIDI